MWISGIGLEKPPNPIWDRKSATRPTPIRNCACTRLPPIAICREKGQRLGPNGRFGRRSLTPARRPGRAGRDGGKRREMLPAAGGPHCSAEVGSRPSLGAPATPVGCRNGILVAGRERQGCEPRRRFVRPGLWPRLGRGVDAVLMPSGRVRAGQIAGRLGGFLIGKKEGRTRVTVC